MSRPPAPLPWLLTAAAALLAASPLLAANALPRWREAFPDFERELTHLNLDLFEQEDSTVVFTPADDTALLAAAIPFSRLRLLPGETLDFPRIHGPETPFPDHRPLRAAAAFRTYLVRRALAKGDSTAALRLTLQGLAQARATLRGQTGVIALIHAIGVWQSALDSAHALLRHPDTPPKILRALRDELTGDAGLAAYALHRAFLAELNDVHRVVLERLPDTDDPDLLLSSVASLGMAPPEPLPPGQPGLGTVSRRLLDREAALADYATELAPVLEALRREPDRLPRAAFTPAAASQHKRATELETFAAYAAGDLEPTPPNLERVRAQLHQVENPIGKLLALYLTPNLPAIAASTYRREAHRQALLGLLAWRLHGTPAPWTELVSAGLLETPPTDPFSSGALLSAPPAQGPARVWSVFLNGHDDGGDPARGNLGLPPDLVWLL